MYVDGARRQKQTIGRKSYVFHPLGPLEHLPQNASKSVSEILFGNLTECVRLASAAGAKRFFLALQDT